MGACSSKLVQLKGAKNWNPIKQVLSKHSIEKLKNEWGKKEFELMMERIKQKGKNGFDEDAFIKLFPKLSNYSGLTKKRIFQLFKVGDGDRITPKETVQALTIIHKCGDQNLIGEVVFYVYCDEEKKMCRKGLQRFKRQNKSFLLENLFDQQQPKMDSCSIGDEECLELKDFFNIFNSYYAEGFVDLFSENMNELEEGIVKILREHPILKRKQGDQVYIVEFNWFRQWRKYMSWKYGLEVGFQNQDKIQHHFRKNSGFSSGISMKRDLRPGIIKNIRLMSGISDGLAPGLREMQDFVFIPVTLGQRMLQIYKMDPILKRSYPELYPVDVFQVFIDSQFGRFTSQIHKILYATKYMRINEIFYENCSNKKQYFCFYKSPGNQNWQEISNFETKLQQLQINRKVYFCFVDHELKSTFERKYNVIDKNGKNFLYHRIRNYAQHLDFPYQGFIKKGTVTKFDKYSVQLEYKVDEYQFEQERISVNYLQPYNSSWLQKMAKKNCLAGMANFENNCYMNSVTQCLIRTSLFGEYLQKQLKKEKHSSNLLLYSLFNLYKCCKKIEVINTKQFKRNVEKHIPYFQGDQHQDAQEFLMSLLNQTAAQIKSMEEFQPVSSIQTFAKQSVSLLSQKTQRVVQFFSGRRISTTQCILCQNKHEIEQQFFTYSLSLPEYKQEEFFFTFYPKKGSLNWGPKFYALTLQKNIKNYEYMEEVAKILGKKLKKLYFVYTSNGQWIGKVADQIQRETYDYKSFGLAIIVYEVRDSQESQEEMIKQKKNSKLTAKVQLRFREERQSLLKYTNLVGSSSLLVEIDNTNSWQDVEQEIQQMVRSYEVKKKPDMMKRSQINKDDSMYRESVIEEPEEMKIQIRIISKQMKDDVCFACKKPFKSFYNKQWFFQSTCKGCIFNPERLLFESNKFVNDYDNLCIVADFSDSSQVCFPKPVEDQSWKQAKAKRMSRRDQLQTIFKDNFKYKEYLELRCDSKSCPSENAYRMERITVFPNILLLHINRFRYKNGNQIKLENIVTYPDDFDFMGIRYLLYGVVAHFGGCKGGHYISYVCEDGQWFKCDDEKVTKDQNKEHINANVYLLFYRRADFQPSLMSLRL